MQLPPTQSWESLLENGGDRVSSAVQTLVNQASKPAPKLSGRLPQPDHAGVIDARENPAVPRRLRDGFDVTMVSTTGLVPAL